MASIVRRSSICHNCAKTLRLDRTSVAPTSWAGEKRRNASTAVDRPFRVGIIGSGPAGFYAALRILQKSQDAVIDMYEQLPAPFGLVRYGVAPDHPEVKNCQERFEEVAASPRFNFIGNVTIGKDVSLRSMKPHYDALLFAYGASQDKTLGIPGEHLKGIYSARAFVGWYNGLPEYDDLDPDLSSGDNAVVIGNGNVALDIARILLSNVDALRETDISEKALESLSRSRIRNVHVCGRRGPMQAAFTIKEIRELMNVPSLAFEPMDEHLLPSAEWVSALPRLEQRKYRVAKLLSQGSATGVANASRTWSLMSLLSPKSFDASSDSSLNMLGGMTLSKTKFEDEAARFALDAKVRSTDETISIPTTLAFRSIGYKCQELPGLSSELGVPFDDHKGIIPNDLDGRVVAIGQDPSQTNTTHVPGCYCAGWVKRGPTGVIASTMEDAFASADSIVNDWLSELPFLNGSTQSRLGGDSRGWDGVLQEADVNKKRDLRRVSWEDWRRIDAVERERGRRRGYDKPREKFRSAAEMLAVLD